MAWHRDPLGIALVWALVLALAKLTGTLPALSWHVVFAPFYVIAAAVVLGWLVWRCYRGRGG